MKKIILIFLTAILLTSCPSEEFRLEELLALDRMSPVLLSFSFRENRTVTLRFDKNVVITDAKIDGVNIEGITDESENVVMTLPSPLSFLEIKTLLFTAEDSSGNTSRYAYFLTGENLNQAKVLITELSADGSETSPDRIELSVIKNGTTGGLYISSGVIEYGTDGYAMPEISVKSGDIIVIYWDRERSGEMIEYRGNSKTIYLNARKEKTLTSTNGAIVVYSNITGRGKISDAIVWRKSDASNSSGFGSERTRLSYLDLVKRNEWSGDAIFSDNTTATRVFARTYPYEDTNYSDDFHITDTSSSTFGRRNTNKIYTK